MVSRIVFCDEPACLSSFVGTPAAAYAAGWRRIGAGRKHHRCPQCRERIGTRPGRKKKLAPPEIPVRRKYRYGREAIVRELEPRGIPMGRVLEMLAVARGEA